MKKLAAALFVLFLAIPAETANAGWTYKVTAFSPSMKVSSRGVATLSIEAPSDFTIRADDPPRVSTDSANGITVKRVRKSQAGLVRTGGMSKLSFDIVLDASKKGTYTLAAEVDFAICAEKICEPRTERLNFDVSVE